ncbi:MAG: pentapeptide repeat-containing protein [Planctomycetota bacterium]|nr:pentapeptide repeat-containing protein [Planctomycetota bacterium]
MPGSVTPAPERAPVRPRIVDPELGGTRPLEDAVQDFLDRGDKRFGVVIGPRGSGKTAALRHLNAVFGARPDFDCFDRVLDLVWGKAYMHAWADLSQQIRTLTGRDDREAQCIFSANAVLPQYEGQGFAVFRLAPWGRDEWIEYLLARHKDSCVSVMNRIDGHPEVAELQGLPALWRVVLDTLAANDDWSSPAEALHAVFAERLSAERLAIARARGILAHLETQENLTRTRACLGGGQALQRVLKTPVLVAREIQSWEPEIAALVDLPLSQLLMAAEQVTEDLRREAECSYFVWRFPADLIEHVARLLRGRLDLFPRLKLLAAGEMPRLQATAASLMLAAAPHWRPPERGSVNLAGACLAGARWSGLHLEQAMLRMADLQHADLSRALLKQADLEEANAAFANLEGAVIKDATFTKASFESANLERAHLTGIRAGLASFRRANLEAAYLDAADLMFADLRGAILRGADLQKAYLKGAKLAGADFRAAYLNGANLEGLVLREANFLGADFPGANLSGADLEWMELPQANFAAAKLRGAYLTGTRMHEARFKGADLRDTGLAEVSWERADLREADLRGASFQMGSSRCGRVYSPIACEGSRTGFYTDEYDEQHFKAPEQIRKANFRGADLRGARIHNVDFYLVDLRDAQLDPNQIEYLRKCGAILEARVDRTNR